MTIQKIKYSGNGHEDNTAFLINYSGGILTIPTFNNIGFFDECYSSVILEEGAHLTQEAEKFLGNVFLDGAQTLEEAIEFELLCKKENQKLISSEEDLSND